MRENKLVSWSIVLVGLALAAVVLKTFTSVMRPMAIAILLMLIFTPVARFSRSKKIPVWITFPVLIVVSVLALGWISNAIMDDNASLTEALPQLQAKLTQNSGEAMEEGSKFGFGRGSLTPEEISDYAAAGARKGLQAVRTIFSETLLALILLLFLIQGKTALYAAVEKGSGAEGLERLQTTIQKIESDTVTYFGTKTAMSLGTAVLSGIVLLLFDASYIYISMLIIFLMNFIPIVGSLVAVVIVFGLFLLTNGLSGTAGGLVASLMAVQVIFGSILEPRIAGKALNMSPLVIILSLYLWGWIWGVIGMFLSVPMTILIMVVTKHVRSQKAADGAPLADVKPPGGSG